MDGSIQLLCCSGLSERSVFKKLPDNRRHILFVDNCSGHNITTVLCDALCPVSTEVMYFNPNTTHFLLPCDRFVIKKLKSCWNKHRERFKMEMI